MAILIDNRVGSRELAPLFPSGVPTCLAALTYADFAWCGEGPDGPVESIGVERKTIGDLCQSISTDRLSGHQLRGLLNGHSHVYLLVEGVFRPSPGTGILQVHRKGRWMDLITGRKYMARDIECYLNTLAVLCGVHVLRTSGPPQSVSVLCALYNWWQKPWGHHRAHLAFEPTPPAPTTYIAKPSLVAQVAAQLPGVGWDRAHKLARRFGTVEALVEADPQELEGVEGVGPVTARKVWRSVRGLK